MEDVMTLMSGESIDSSIAVNNPDCNGQYEVEVRVTSPSGFVTVDYRKVQFLPPITELEKPREYKALPCSLVQKDGKEYVKLLKLIETDDIYFVYNPTGDTIVNGRLNPCEHPIIGVGRETFNKLAEHYGVDSIFEGDE